MSSQQSNLMNVFFTSIKISTIIALTATNLSLFDRSARAERGCVVTDEGDTICGSTTPKKSKQQPSQSTGSKKVVTNNLLVELKRCSRQDETNIVCEFSITNKGERGYLSLSSSSSGMIDSSGKSRQALSSQLGSSGGVLGASIDEAEPGIAYAASLTFKNIPQSIKKAQLLTVGVLLNYRGSRIQFRNIPFSN
jgi:hypothetical protein